MLRTAFSVFESNVNNDSSHFIAYHALFLLLLVYNADAIDSCRSIFKNFSWTGFNRLFQVRPTRDGFIHLKDNIDTTKLSKLPLSTAIGQTVFEKNPPRKLFRKNLLSIDLRLVRVFNLTLSKGHLLPVI